MTHTTLKTAVRAIATTVLILTTWTLSLAQTESNSKVGSDYRISASDTLNITVLRDPDGSAENLRVSKSGSIEHPYMGKIKLMGLTESQAATKLATALRDGYLVNPKVTVSVVNYAKMRFTILGSVNAPDTYEVPANKRITIIEAIGLGKGFQDSAKRNKVKLSRLVSGQVLEWEINVKGMVSNPKKFQPVYLQDGDVIHVPESFL